MNSYAIKYRPGAGGEFLLCMIEGLDQGIIVEPDENNRYVGSHVDSWHQNMAEYFRETGLTDNTVQNFSKLPEPDKHCMTFHLWTLDYIVQLKKKNTRVLIVNDNTLHSDILAFHKIPSYKEIEDQVTVQMPRYQEWAQVYSDNDYIMNYARNNLDIREVEHDELYEYSFDELEELLEWLADVKLTDEWYEIFEQNTLTNKGIINTYKEQFLKYSEINDDT